MLLNEVDYALCGSVSGARGKGSCPSEFLEGGFPMPLEVVLEALPPLLIEADCVGLLHDADVLVIPECISCMLLSNIDGQFLSRHILTHLGHFALLLIENFVLTNSKLIKKVLRDDIDGVEVSGGSFASGHHAIDMAQVIAILGHQVVNVPSDEHAGTIALSGCFQSRSHMHMRAEVAGIDLVLRTDGALNGPPDV